MNFSCIMYMYICMYVYIYIIYINTQTHVCTHALKIIHISWQKLSQHRNDTHINPVSHDNNYKMNQLHANSSKTPGVCLTSEALSTN